MEVGFEFPRELEKLFHEKILTKRREQQRVQFRPGVHAVTKAVVDVLQQDRTKKKLARAIHVLQDEYAVPDEMIREALAYTNKLEDALQFLTLQYTSDQLPMKLRALPKRYEGTAAEASGENDHNRIEVVAVHKNSVAMNNSIGDENQAHVDVDDWETLVASESENREEEKKEEQVPNTEESRAEEHALGTKEAESAMSWTQRYVMMMAEQEEEQQGEMGKLSAEEKRIKELEDTYVALLDYAKQAKEQKKTKKRQKMLADEIQMVRRQLDAAGWQESEFYTRQNALRESGSNYNKKNKKSRVKDQEKSHTNTADNIQEQHDAAASSNENEDRQSLSLAFDKHDTSVVTDSNANDVADDSNIDDDGDVGLFGLLEDAESSVVDADTMQKSSPVTVEDYERAKPSTDASKSQKKKGRNQLKAASRSSTATPTWTGKTPRDHLQDYCHKRKLPRPLFKKMTMKGRRFLYSVTLDMKTHKKEFVVTDDFDAAHGFDTIEDAKDMVATYALYALTPELPLYRGLPSKYRDLWLSWVQTKEKEAAAIVGAEKDAFETVVDDIFNQVPSEIREKVVAASDAVGANELNAHQVQSATDDGEQNILDEWSVDDWDADLSDAEGEKLEEHANNEVDSAIKDVSSRDHNGNHRKLSQQFKKRMETNMQSSLYQKLHKRRMELPISSFKSQILDALEKHNVILISGETGCGKSTQVPQFLLEDMVLKKNDGARCQIVCTQPRRLAAISLAERVSQELGEEVSLGSSESLCGYQIRLENRMTKDTRLLFCTTGILLRKLQEPKILGAEISHIIVDEVHERDLQNDVLLSILRQFLATTNASCSTPLKVILMSATLHAESFQQYFGGEQVCPMLSVPGRTFPVQEFFLEDVLEATDFVVDETSVSYRPVESIEHSTQIQISGRGGTSYSQRVTWSTSNAKTRSFEKQSQLEQDTLQEYSDRTLKSLGCLDPSIINYELIQELIEHLIQQSDALALDNQQPSASILVFLPGMQEISSLLDLLSSSRMFQDEQKFHLIPLHSSLSPQDQQRIFHMPKGVVRIIATTNIAETSLTIEDVKVVIDSGKVKEMRHDSTRRTNILDEIWISRANAKQRMGRAGRTSGGLCYRLFPRSVYYHEMNSQPVAEIKRAPLTSLCLQIKTFGVIAMSCREFLGTCLDPPDDANVRDALNELYEIGALESENENLTPLGYHLARLPVDVKVGKMLLLGAIFNVFDAISTCVAILETRSPFVAPFGHQAEMQAARKRFAIGCSDLLTDVNAYELWRAQFQQSEKRSHKEEKAFCMQHFLNKRALIEITKIKRQFYSLVSQLGFLPSQSQVTTRTMTSQEFATIAAIVYAGLAPNLVHVEQQSSQQNNKLALLREYDRGLVLIHPGSINYKVMPFPSHFLTYPIKLHTSQVYLPSSHLVMPASICLFSHQLEILPQLQKNNEVSDRGEIAMRVNDWIMFQTTYRSAILFQEIRGVTRAFIDNSLQYPPYSSRESKTDSERLFFEQLISALENIFRVEYEELDQKQQLMAQLICNKKHVENIR